MFFELSKRLRRYYVQSNTSKNLSNHVEVRMNRLVPYPLLARDAVELSFHRSRTPNLGPVRIECFRPKLAASEHIYPIKPTIKSGRNGAVTDLLQYLPRIYHIVPV